MSSAMPMSSATSSRVLTENDIPGSSFGGKLPALFKKDELRFWLKCRGDSLKGLKTKAQYVKRVEAYIQSGRDKFITDPDKDQIYTKRKQRRLILDEQSNKKQLNGTTVYLSLGWSKDLKRMPFFTRAEMNLFIVNSGKNLTHTPCVQSNFRKATTFLHEEYLKNIFSSTDEKYFYFKAQCHHSFKKNDPPHELKIALCLITGNVKNAQCSCVAGKVGFCNHVLALMMKLCKFSLYNCVTINELDNEIDMQPQYSCTSKLQQWHHKTRGDDIKPEPVMNIMVNKPTTMSDKPETSRGVRCQLYEARNNLKRQTTDEIKFKSALHNINHCIPLATIMQPENNSYIHTKFGESPEGSYASYQLSITEHNFEVCCSTDSVPRSLNTVSLNSPIPGYPSFPISDMQTPTTYTTASSLGKEEKQLLEHLTCDCNKVNDIETQTRDQAESQEWVNQRKFRITASNFGLVKNRKRNHENLVTNLINPKSFTSRHTMHGKKYESVAIQQYEKYMRDSRNPVTVQRSGFVVDLDNPFLGASPDGKVIDYGCSEMYGILEVKCPETKFQVTPLDACSDPAFYLENIDGMPRLKHNHTYYDQVQGQLGVTKDKWCDFVVYTNKGMCIKRFRLNESYWSELKHKLRCFYFEKFLPIAAIEFTK
ncbi:hypothetical protein AC249_AIPGENE28139 [Paramuricea clavata]|uniref:Uncharacterized protein n=1 Tax=Paramuricea clavata TaxID=317549 RepID=A0A7D9IBM7_PARCT|nr:hypothetical protein AC249_AIPGENE28139 [Paramuricea clavata]